MESILDQILKRQRNGSPERRTTSAPLEAIPPRPRRQATVRVGLQSLPASGRERSSARAEHIAAAPTPGLGGVSQIPTALLEEANREWFIWRFGDDA
jgi:hypothetical protein